jgi:hypothetical protein
MIWTMRLRLQLKLGCRPTVGLCFPVGKWQWQSRNIRIRFFGSLLLSNRQNFSGTLGRRGCWGKTKRPLHENILPIKRIALPAE